MTVVVVDEDTIGATTPAMIVAGLPGRPHQSLTKNQVPFWRNSRDPDGTSNVLADLPFPMTLPKCGRILHT